MVPEMGDSLEQVLEAALSLFYIYICMCGGGNHSVMVTVVVNEHGNPSSNPG